jgi:pimeloyl-ACP methyl ester carboxylesterase
MMRVQVNGADLEYLDEGSGVPVVFSHGGNSDVRYWEPQREVFAARYRFVTYSRRFHGSSARPTDDTNSTEAHVTDLIEIMRGLQAGPVHLVGFSTSLGLYAALRAPDLLRSLTIIEPNVPSLLEGDPEGETVLAWWRTENARVNAESGGDGDYRPVARLRFELINNRGPGTFDIQPEGLRQMWLDNFGAERPAARPSDPLMCEQLAAISLPTLVMAAEYGMPYSRRITDVLSRCIPTSRLTVIPGVTHFMSYQEPAAFNEAVIDFIEQH